MEKLVSQLFCHYETEYSLCEEIFVYSRSLVLRIDGNELITEKLDRSVRSQYPAVQAGFDVFHQISSHLSHMSNEFLLYLMEKYR